MAERTVPVFVPVPVSCCHTEARRHCFRMECRRSGAAPSFSLSPDLAAQHREGRWEREQEARLQTEPVTPTPFRDAAKQLVSRRARALRSAGAGLSCTCTRPPFVVQQGDSRLFHKHGARKQTPCLDIRSDFIRLDAMSFRLCYIQNHLACTR